MARFSLDGRILWCIVVAVVELRIYLIKHEKGEVKEMIYPIFLIVCFVASIVGAICGIGGGVIIKPVLDSLRSVENHM